MVAVEEDPQAVAASREAVVTLNPGAVNAAVVEILSLAAIEAVVEILNPAVVNAVEVPAGLHQTLKAVAEGDRQSRLIAVETEPEDRMEAVRRTLKVL